jgi:hypothetical protein
MSKWNFVAMGQAGLTSSTRAVAQPVARSVARRTGRPETEILSYVGAAVLTVTPDRLSSQRRCRHRNRANRPVSQRVGAR